MGLKESGLRGSLRNVSVGIDAIPDSENLHAHYDAQLLLLDDQDTMSEWPDQSGNDNDIPSVGSPTYETDAINGNPAVLFDGEDDKFEGDWDDLDSAPYSIYVVVVLNNTSITGRIVNEDSNNQFLRWDDGNWETREVSGSSDENIKQLSFLLENSNFAALYEEGAETGTTTSPRMETWSDLTIGARETENYWEGHIGEIIFYDVFHDSETRQEVESYLFSRWGI